MTTSRPGNDDLTGGGHDLNAIDEERCMALEYLESFLHVRVDVLGGSVTGEHGMGWVKGGQLARQWVPAALDLHDAVKRIFDPRGILNPGKKLSRRNAAGVA